VQLDHIFVGVDDLATAERLGQALGLRETYRRTHAGQGTSNICYCFDNAFLELLVLEDADDAASPAIVRTGLAQRLRWKQSGACPIGIAWRLGIDEPSPDIGCWEFAPPYLPTGTHIPVATESDDLAGPMLFQSPGTAAPLDWPLDRRGGLQLDAGLRTIEQVLLYHPPGFVPGPAMRQVAGEVGVTVRGGTSPNWSLVLRLERHDYTRIDIRVL
jgi:hypothetical protein